MAAHSDSAQVRKPAKEVPCKSSCSSNPGLRIGFVTLAGIICAVITESSLLLFADGQRYSRRTHGEEKWTLSSLHGTGAHDDTTRHSQLVYPVIIDGGGDVIDHNLEMLQPLHLMSDVTRESESHRRLRRSSGILQEVRVRVSAFNRDFHFLLEPNLDLLSNHLQLDYHINQSATPTPSSASSSEQTEDDEQRSRRPTALDVSHLIGCFMSGRLEEDSESQAAINVCNGMTGMFVSGDREFIIEPVQSTSSSSSGEHTAGDYRNHPHLLTQTTRSRSSSSTVQRRRMQTNADSAQQRVQRFNGVQCGVKEKAKGTALPAPVMTDQDDVAVSGDDSSNQGDGRYGNGDSDGHRQRRSVSYRYYVETYIVADDAFYRRHGDASIHIMLNAMNMVSTLFKDPTLGNNVKITTSKIDIGQQGLRKQYRVNVDNATQTLDNFCQWQSEMNGTRVTAGGGLSSYHDVAVLFTGENMCSRPNTGCEVVGIGKMGGMCSSRRSCSVAEDTGLFIAFTIAHELGHNFNMPHDGDGNKCGIGYGKRYVPGLMANKASNISKAYQWSKCSRDYITDFLDGGGGECLRNPSNNTRRTNLEYGAREQCQLSYGPNSVPCREDSSMCQSLWCTTNNRERCTMRSLPPLSGTPCPLHSSNPHVKDGVCHRGNCLPPQSLQPVDGGWNDWSEWGACSLTCGRGIRKRDRQCTNPEPVNNGQYCIGERAQYRFCVEADVQDQCGYVDGEALWKYQCSFFDSYRFGDQLATARDGNWTVPNNIVTNRKPTCSLDCYNGRHVRTLAQHVIDGTPCTFDSSDICVSGRCVAVGCDGNLATDNGDGSGTVKRMSVCGQCGGNNSACVTVTRRWRSWRDARRQTGSVFVMALPGGATTVRIQEKDPLAETFIGLVANDSRQEIISTTSIKAAGYHRVSASPHM
ncbi:A disintegrin and metalloproteinase with thrombospondin motifs 6-like [Sycon ciliatum]|uniref:A disintegrin and metalloproteinase with thrombospondin motifs 6-like n=1 Tax=Sycon ciliatum TaxID=27933 RepID=UPI0031F5FB54